MNITESIQDSLQSWGDNPVLVESTPRMPDRILDRDGFEGAVRSAAVSLSKLGVKRGVPIPLFLENSIDFPVLLLALLEIGAVPVMVKLDYRKRELDGIFGNLTPSAVISEHAHLPVLADRLNGIHVISRKGNGVLSVAQWGDADREPADIPDDVATINYTYRGYGIPLGSMASHGQYIHGAEVLQQGLQADPGESMLVNLPMSHIFTLIGCITVPLMNGLTAVVSRTMNPVHLFHQISEKRIAHLLSVPEIYELLCRFSSHAAGIDSMKTFVSGGSLLTPEKYHRYTETFGVQVLHGYGLTEFTPVSRNMRNRPRPGTIGPVCDGIECSIADDGEILVTTPHITRGYYRQPEITAEALTENGFRTGDLGYFDDGHLVFDREKKRTRKINGNIVDLVEVEETIREFPAVDRFRLVFENGKLSADVTFTGDPEGGIEGLRSHLIDSIARYKVPRLSLGGEM